MRALLDHATAQEATIAVVELADGVFQRETAALLRSEFLRGCMSGLVFAAPDAIGALGGVSHLRSLGIEPIAVSGKVSRSPLATAEVTAASGVSALTREALRDSEIVRSLVGPLVAPTVLPPVPVSQASYSGQGCAA